MTALRVLAVGSCRVFRPLRAAEACGVIDLVNKTEKWWFTHSKAGAHQYVDVLAGNKDVPQELRQLTCETMIEDLSEDLSAPHMLDVSVVVLEVFTMRQLILGPTHLNHQRVWGHVNEQGLPTAPVLWGDTSALPDDDVIRGLKAAKYTPESIERDVLAIQKLVGGAPIVTVDHLHAATADGSVAAERLHITETLAGLDERLGMPLQSTAGFIEEFGPDSMLDHNHWASDAEASVGERLSQFASSRIKG